MKRIQPVQTLFEVSCQSLTVLQLNSCSFMNSHLLTVIAKNCKQLTHLSLRSCTNIESRNDETQDGFVQLKNLSELRHLDLYRTLVGQAAICEIINHCTKIDTLNLGACVKISDFDQVMTQIAKCLNGIKSLDLWRAYSLTNRGLNEISKSCFKLEELDIGWWYVYSFLEIL